MSKIIDPFAGARTSIQAQRAVNRSKDTSGTLNVNRGDLGAQIEELKTNYLISAGYAEAAPTVNSEEKELLDLLKQQYGDLNSVKELLLNKSNDNNTNKLQLINNVKQNSIDNRSDEEKLLDNLLSEI